MGIVQRAGLGGSSGSPHSTDHPINRLQPSKRTVFCKSSSGIMHDSFQGHKWSLSLWPSLVSGCLLCSFYLRVLVKAYIVPSGETYALRLPSVPNYNRPLRRNCTNSRSGNSNTHTRGLDRPWESLPSIPSQLIYKPNARKAQP